MLSYSIIAVVLSKETNVVDTFVQGIFIQCIHTDNMLSQLLLNSVTRILKFLIFARIMYYPNVCSLKVVIRQMETKHKVHRTRCLYIYLTFLQI